jgi:hypothetical protein
MVRLPRDKRPKFLLPLLELGNTQRTEKCLTILGKGRGVKQNKGAGIGDYLGGCGHLCPALQVAQCLKEVTLQIYQSCQGSSKIVPEFLSSDFISDRSCVSR